jgi:3-deoxy-D-manno-octulosonate 8-phosphate phosphatase KdsC-like HAD superfamily phosphatase
VDEVRDRVDHVLERSGGNAAVRELVELLLRARGSWAAAVAPFVEPLR